MARPLPLLVLAMGIGIAGSGAVRAQAGEDPVQTVGEAVQELRVEARRVWSDARAVVIVAWIEVPSNGDPRRVGVEMTLVTSKGIVDGRWLGEGDALPTLSLKRRSDPVPMAVRHRWEREFGILRKIDWTHVSSEWLGHCGLPRAQSLEPGQSVHMKLEAGPRVPLLVLRHSEGYEACVVDDRGTIHPFEGAEL